MSLATDSIFIAALRSSEELTAAVSGRIYGTAIPLPDVDADNAPVPYIIVTFDSLRNDLTNKDCSYEGDYDQVQIGIEVAAQTLEALHRLTQQVRDVVRNYMRSNDTEVDGYQFSAQPIMYNSLKPCYWQELNYQCDVYLNTEIHDQ